ncbi:hypothetical protein [Pseudalkalibacillus sp. SCS-8]|uniref:hypothetical protein n=1 Tax=Pseudalkalibacillus nanhaiensis TaxID=3115291 RepID=UPI0032D9B5A4
MRYLSMIFICIALLTGCAFGDNPEKLKEQTIEGMKPSVKGKYAVYAYYKQLPPNPADTEQVKIYYSMDERIPLEKVETLSVVSISNEDLNLFNIEKSPSFIVVDKTGIVLQTTDIDKVIDFLKNNDPVRID